MRLIKDDGKDDGEPGEWTSGPQLVDTELVTIQLCRFTGERLVDDEACAARDTAHPDLECAQTYVSVEQVAWWLHQLPTELRHPISWRKQSHPGVRVNEIRVEAWEAADGTKFSAALAPGQEKLTSAERAKVEEITRGLMR